MKNTENAANPMSRNGFGVDGVDQMPARLRAQGIDWRGLYKNAGSAGWNPSR